MPGCKVPSNFSASTHLSSSAKVKDRCFYPTLKDPILINHTTEAPPNGGEMANQNPKDEAEKQAAPQN
ncbi:unnamed protein product [Linum trigynum]|uniref:Uncharacterized protein n=1 Tax=Linum trigynum TaxID=586398 RepID=A0AAV2DAM6_9ROSI